jgi:uncharacterized membrane protein required for colicin V production
MNWLDVVLILLFVVGLVGGYLQGLIRQALSLGAVACAIILGTYLHVPIAAFLAFTYPQSGVATQETAAFLFSAVALTVVLEVVQRKAVPESRLLALGALDQIAGLIVAVFAVGLQMSIFILVLNFFVTPSWPIGGTMRLFLLQGMQSSALAPAFYNLLAVLVTVVGRLLPEGRPRLLAFR